ncbi:hypothetical protein [Hymenobacter edaphi]|uniref:hypothetical protein n=1 Tax=Hymenobacter edaphi TaxID=2211146 RepID=UPI0010576101|nr:hypothetical protein [Hymenobacter edaphi]
MKTKYFLFSLLLLSSCVDHFEEAEVYGHYTPKYIGNFDTLELRPQGVYQRRVYDSNKKLLLKMRGEWSFESENRILLDRFYLNLDDDLVKFPELVQDTAGGVNTYFETQNETIKFCIGYESDENCFYKVAQK